MKLARIKLFVIAVFILSMMAMVIFNTKPVGTIVKATADDDTAAFYKAKCAMCHSPKAEKLFNMELKDEEMVQVILKGKKIEKPPHMPEFETKGMTEEKAKALVTYMRELRKPAS